MYQIHITKQQDLTLFMLENKEEKTQMIVAPERGGIIKELILQGEPVFYINNDTFFDLTKNVRGGNPILFPICAQLKNKTYEYNGKQYMMNNHGFARTMPWKVIDQSSSKDSAMLKISLTSTEKTLKEYPFEFEVIFTYLLSNGKLSIEQEYKNLSNEEMPFYAGFHPYFKASHHELEYTIPSSIRFDDHDEKWKDVQSNVNEYPIDEAQIFYELTENKASFYNNRTNKNTILTFGPEFKYVAVWSENPEEFVCVEPLMAKKDEMNRKEELVYLQPRENLKTFFQMEMEDPNLS